MRVKTLITNAWILGESALSVENKHTPSCLHRTRQRIPLPSGSSSSPSFLCCVFWICIPYFFNASKIVSSHCPSGAVAIFATFNISWLIFYRTDALQKQAVRSPWDTTSPLWLGKASTTWLEVNRKEAPFPSKDWGAHSLGDRISSSDVQQRQRQNPTISLFNKASKVEGCGIWSSPFGGSPKRKFKGWINGWDSPELTGCMHLECIPCSIPCLHLPPSASGITPMESLGLWPYKWVQAMGSPRRDMKGHRVEIEHILPLLPSCELVPGLLLSSGHTSHQGHPAAESSPSKSQRFSSGPSSFWPRALCYPTLWTPFC